MNTIPNRTPRSIVAAAVYLGTYLIQRKAASIVSSTEMTVRKVLHQVNVQGGLTAKEKADLINKSKENASH